MKIKSQMLVIEQLNEHESQDYNKAINKLQSTLQLPLDMSRMSDVKYYSNIIDEYRVIAEKRYFSDIINKPIVAEYKSKIRRCKDPIQLERLLKEFHTIVSNPYVMMNDDYDVNWMDIIEEPEPDGIPLHWFDDPIEPIELIPGTPMVIGAYSGVGKTTVMINLAYHYFIHNKKQLIFTLEWRAKMLIRGLYKLNLKSNDTDDKINKWDRKTIDAMMLKNKSNFIHFNNAIKIKSNDKRIRRIDIMDIENNIESLALRGELPEIIYIDYLQRISNNEAETKRLDARGVIMDTMFRLTQLSKKHNFILILLAQTNRTGHNAVDIIPNITKHLKAPDSKDLQESSSIEQDAAIVMTLGRVKQYKEDYDKMELCIVKNRFGYETTKFVNIHKKSSYMDRIPDDKFNIEELKENANLTSSSKQTKPKNNYR